MTDVFVPARQIREHLREGTDFCTALTDLRLQTETLEDGYPEWHPAPYSFHGMLMLFLYREVTGDSYRAITRHPELADVFEIERIPDESVLSRAWRNRFNDDVRGYVTASAHCLVKEVHNEDLSVPEVRPLEEMKQSADEPSNPPEGTTKFSNEEIYRTTRLVREHGFGPFYSGRAENRIYEDEQILDLFTNACLTQGSAHSEGETGWFLDENDVCDDSTLLRVIKQFSMPSGQELPKPLQEYSIEDIVALTEEFRGDLMDSFDAATENVLSTIHHEDPFDDRHVVAAIDFTHVPYHVWPWIDKERQIPKSDYPPMVSGYLDDGVVMYGYTFATITIVGNKVPIILGIEPVKERSEWEPADAPTDSKSEILSRLLKELRSSVDLNEVLLDRGFFSSNVYAEIHDRGLLYTTPVPKYEEDYTAIAKIQSKDSVDVAVKHDVPLAIEGEVHHTVEFLYVPATSDNADGNYAVFVTNRDHVDPAEITHVTNSYSRRWDIENQYKSVKEFLPKTSSKGYRVRLFTFTFAALLYNLWRLTDYLVKVGMDRDIRSPPVVTARTFVRAVGQYLREGG